jgi:hypothetical protein
MMDPHAHAQNTLARARTHTHTYTHTPLGGFVESGKSVLVGGEEVDFSIQQRPDLLYVALVRCVYKQITMQKRMLYPPCSHAHTYSWACARLHRRSPRQRRTHLHRGSPRQRRTGKRLAVLRTVLRRLLQFVGSAPSPQDCLYSCLDAT